MRSRSNLASAIRFAYLLIILTHAWAVREGESVELRTES
jgi:hypothetical protein